MTRGAWILSLLGGLVLAVFVAGFFRSPERSLAGLAAKGEGAPYRPLPALAEPLPVGGRSDDLGKVAWSTGQPASTRSGGLPAIVASPSYKRAADLSLKVDDCTRAEDALEARLEAMKGEILEMLMEGTEGSRTCTLSVLIPADKFREFVADLRKMGKVQAEKITASKLKPGELGGVADAKDAPDPLELSLVAVRMADEKVAQKVLESRSLLASSFDQSASHFMNGMATLVEALGYALPYVIALSALVVPLLAVARIRRAREVRLPS